MGIVKGVPLIFISAKTGQRKEKIIEETLRVYEKWNTRVSTSLLNKWAREFQKLEKMPNISGKMLKIKFVMQVKSRPPTFYLCVNKKEIVS